MLRETPNSKHAASTAISPSGLLSSGSNCVKLSPEEHKRLSLAWHESILGFDMLTDPGDLTLDQIEAIEKLTMRWLFQAVSDMGTGPMEVFLRSPDDPDGIAEDVTREILDRLPGFNTSDRIYGDVDYRKSRYLLTPDLAIRQALFVDSKANLSPTDVRIQMTQLSIRVNQLRQGQPVSVAGTIDPIYKDDEGRNHISTTTFLHYHYEHIASDSRHHLRSITILCVPNGLLQNRYNPSAQDSFWKVGPDSPTRGEKFRTRVNLKVLASKSGWRVQSFKFDESRSTVSADWAH